MTVALLFTKYFGSIEQFEGFDFIFPAHLPPKACSATAKCSLQPPPPPLPPLPPPGAGPVAPVTTARRT